MRQAVTLDQWISAATRDLSDDAVARIRTEITDHYQAARDSGHTPEAALAFFGDSKKANRQYRRVYLTRKEVVVAGAFANPRERFKKAINHDLVYLILVGWCVSRSGLTLQNLLWTLFWTLFFSQTPLVAFYPPNTKERCYNHLRIFIGRALFSVLCLGYGSPTAGLILLGIWLPLVMHSDEYRRWKVSRKLPHFPEGIPVVPEVPATYLTDFESCTLQSLRRLRAWHYAGIALVCLGVVLYAFLSPLVGGSLLVALSFAYLVPRFVSIKTPDRGRRFRRIKWYLFALTAVAPPCYVIFGYLEPDLRRIGIFTWASAFTYLILFAHVFREAVLIRLRKKLPFDQWPERLHQ